jgi:membrane-associated phospholipid phosphatase
MAPRARQWICALLLLCAPPPASLAQDTRLFTPADVWVAGAFAVGTVAMFRMDEQVIRSVRDSARLHSPGFDRAARAFGFLGSPGTFIAVGSLYGAGLITDEARLRQLALHGAEGMLAGLVAAGVLKGTLGRSRPFVTADTNPRDFALFRGFRADRFQAFPSGHTTTAFAFAAALTADLHRWDRGAAWMVGPILYGGAAITGMSRMYEDKHWASDVVMGAAIGTVAGIKVVRYSRTDAGRRLDRRILGDDAAVRWGYVLRW